MVPHFQTKWVCERLNLNKENRLQADAQDFLSTEKPSGGARETDMALGEML
jgi:hypothetical protein